MGGVSDSDQEGEAKPKRIADFARDYDVSDRTVKRWNKTGISAADAPPLENPELMRAWWARNMKQAEPAGISAAAIRARQAAHSDPPSKLDLALANIPDSTPPPQIEDKAAARQALLDQPIDESDFSLENIVRDLHQLRARLNRVADQPGQATPYVAVVSRLTNAIKDLTDQNIRHRKLIPKSEAEAMIYEFHAPIERAIRQLAKTMLEKTGLPCTPQINEEWNKECDRVFTSFQMEVFR